MDGLLHIHHHHQFPCPHSVYGHVTNGVFLDQLSIFTHLQTLCKLCKISRWNWLHTLLNKSDCLILQIVTRYFYRPQTKVWKSKGFTPVCQSFCSQRVGGVCLSDCWDTHPTGQTPLGRHPPPADGHCSGRYASYWNAFLLNSHSDVCGFLNSV